jgi:hypothetical protein
MYGIHRAIATVEDAQAARLLVDTWTEDHFTDNGAQALAEKLLVLRGLVTSALADVREAGYIEGVQRGRRDVGVMIRNTLAGEGL